VKGRDDPTYKESDPIDSDTGSIQANLSLIQVIM